MRHGFLFTVAIAASLLAGCNNSSPTAPLLQATEPARGTLAMGRWSSEGSACMTVAQTESSLIAGCWRGRFPTPSLRTDGTFDVDGTFRFEAGPSQDTPGAPAHFSGRIDGTTLTLTVQQTTPSAAPATPVSFALTFNGDGACSPLCV
jgi:hypothetical protein